MRMLPFLYRFQLLLRFRVDEQKRFKNAKCGRENFWKTGQKILPFQTKNGYVWTGLKIRSTTRMDSLIALHVLFYYHLVRRSLFLFTVKQRYSRTLCKPIQKLRYPDRSLRPQEISA